MAEFPDEAGIDFMRGTIPGHQGAGDVATVVREYGRTLKSANSPKK
jgi:hypothetical protein